MWLIFVYSPLLQTPSNSISSQEIKTVTDLFFDGMGLSLPGIQFTLLSLHSGSLVAFSSSRFFSWLGQKWYFLAIFTS